MARKPRLYARLTRATATVGSYRSLWLGPDHLLLVTSTGYTEEYRRIDFDKIQGMMTLTSERRTSWAVGWTVIAALSAILIGASYVTGGHPVVPYFFLGFGLLGLTWNHLLGPTCKVYVMTGVQTLQLPSLVRQRKAARVLARIEPLIALAQQARWAPAPSVSGAAPSEEPPTSP
jgi:hypothetical protein